MEGESVSALSLERQAFRHYLRTGRRISAELRKHSAGRVELKFNPYHDPRDGRFTFAPGGPRSLAHVTISDRNRMSGRGTPKAPVAQSASKDDRTPELSTAVYTADGNRARFQAVSLPGGPGGARRGSNIRAFQDPMTLEQTFPGLRNTPAGNIVALADNIFGFSGPAQGVDCRTDT